MKTSSDPLSGNEWELSKENVQPLKQGRKMANLTAALAPSSLDQTRIHREKQEFEAEIRTYKGEDPLDIWYRYIVWMSENFPKGGKDFGTLLESCISLFKDEEMYRNDERYAKVWLRYTDICTDPMDIYNYMHSQQVCSGLALFYESWALLLENLGDCKKADEVYSLGINRKAQPLDRLVKQHRAFEVRLAEKISNGMQQVSLTEDTEPHRTTLGGLRPHGKKGAVGTKRTGHATLPSKGGLKAVSQVPNSSNPFKIFCDGDTGSTNSLPPSTGEWQMPPTEPVIKKENSQKPGKWSNAKVSQRHQLCVPFSGASEKPNFTVHIDEDVASHPPCTPQHVSQFDKVLSARKPDKPFVTESLKNKSENEHSEGQNFKVMYCKEKIYAGTEEFSLEELRAARVFAQMRAGTYVQPAVEKEPEKNVRYMYPKKEVYSFDGEYQWEEILAKRYLARLEKQRTLRSVEHSVQEAQPKKMPREFVPAKEEPFSEEPMEVASCQKSMTKASAGQGPDVEFHHHSSIPSSIDPAVRRGLAFGGPSSTHLYSNEDASTVSKEAPRMSSLSSGPANAPQCSGPRSAFRLVRNQGLHSQPSSALTSTYQENPATVGDSRQLNVSSRYDAENVHTNRTNQLMGPSVSNPQPSAFIETVSAQTPGMSQVELQMAKNKIAVYCRTPDANRSGDLNSSHFAGPSPTVFTKQALEEVRNMFNGPLESERDVTSAGGHQELNESDKDFEAAFSNDNATTGLAGLGGFGAASGFVIYEEPADRKGEEPEAEDKENMPPRGSRQETSHRPLAGILQPSVGIPTCPLENPDQEEEEETVNRDKENNSNRSYQIAHQQEQINEVSLADYAHDHTFASVSFATAARVASTPFCNGIEPPSLPSIPWSTIRPTADNNQVLNDLAAAGENANAHVSAGLSGGSFMSTPSKVLSPIFERSNEDSKSTNSSHSSTASSRRGSCSVGASLHSGVELSKIQEEASSCHADEAPRSGNKQNVPVTDPFAAEVIDEFLLRIQPPVSTYEGLFESGREMPRIAANVAVSLGNDDVYRVEKVVGSGAFAKVYMARKLRAELEIDDLEMDDDDSAVVLKVQGVSVEWEFYICRQLHKRMDDMGCTEDSHAMFMNPQAAYLYRNSSVLVDRYNSLGTLLDMVNKYKIKQKSIEQYVAMYYTIALLRILETMHAFGIIHGDIKPDNFIVLDSDGDSPNAVPLQLIDFGRSVDMTLFPPGTTFTANCYTEDFQCTEMKDRKPWTTQIDTYGVLGTIHCLVFGEYMKVFKDEKGSGRWKTTKSFKRHWESLWGTLFDTLLNAPSCDEQPTLQEFRQEFEKIYMADEINSARHKRKHDVLMFE